jgi:hypothetical protein
VANVKSQYNRLPVYNDYPGYRVKIKINTGTIAGRFKPRNLSRNDWAGHAFDIVASIRAYKYGNMFGYELVLESADLVVQV